MANDPPTNLRIGFGYPQARAAGLGGIRRDRSPKQVNRITADNKTDRFMEDLVLRWMDGDRDWVPFVAHWLKEGLSVQPAYPRRLKEGLVFPTRPSLTGLTALLRGLRRQLGGPIGKGSV